MYNRLLIRHERKIKALSRLNNFKVKGSDEKPTGLLSIISQDNLGGIVDIINDIYNSGKIRLAFTNLHSHKKRTSVHTRTTKPCLRAQKNRKSIN